MVCKIGNWPVSFRYKGLNFTKKLWGQLVPKLPDLVTSELIIEKLVASEKQSVTLATTVVATSSSGCRIS